MNKGGASLGKTILTIGVPPVLNQKIEAILDVCKKHGMSISIDDLIGVLLDDFTIHAELIINCFNDNCDEELMRRITHSLEVYNGRYK